MKTKIVIMMMVVGSYICAQSKHFYYEVTFKLDSSETTARKDILVLEVNKNNNIFMSNDYIVTDSINNVHKNNKIFAYPKFRQVVEYQKSDDSFNFINNLSPNFYVYNTKKKISWSILNERKKIGNFEVIKAVTDYGGRHWTAWFSTEIPMPYGPYVFYGLPGLILEIYDNKDNYHFSFIQNKNYKTDIDSGNIIKNLFGDRKILIKEKDWKTIQLNYYNNPIAEYKKGEEAMMMKNDGSQYTANDYRDLEKKLQNQIKKYNNPIELNEKIDYK